MRKGPLAKTVLFFNNTFPSKKNPAEGTYAETIANVIKEAGYNVDYHVLNNTGNKILDYAKYFIHLAFMKLPCEGEILYINHFSMLLPLIFRLLFKDELVVFHWHGEELVRNNYIFKIIRSIIRKVIKSNNIHISPSLYYVSIIKSVLQVPESQIVVSPSGGIDLSSFYERNIPDMRTVHLGFPSALNNHKGVEYLRMVIINKKHLEKLIGKRIYIHVIDYGEDRKKFLDNIPKDLKNDIIVLGKLPHSQITNFYQNIHLTLFFSMRESLGLTVLESLSCGVPVIARNNTSMPELIISNETGELVSNNPSYNEIENTIVYMLTNISRYKTRNFIEKRYSRNSVVNQYKEILGSLK